MIPQNLLASALSIVGMQQFVYNRFQSRSVNITGDDVVIYEAPVWLKGNVQAVPLNVYQQYGLEYQRNYLTFYISKDIIDIGRDVSGDTIEFGGAKYQCLSLTDWYNINGWVNVLAVRLANA